MWINYNFDELLSNVLEVPLCKTSFWEAYQHLPSIEDELRMTSAWLAGGALLRLIANENSFEGDFDLFFPSVEARENYEKDLICCGFVKEIDNYYLSQWNKKGIKVQLIKLIYTKKEYIIDSFDYTICQLIYDGEFITVGPYTLWDISNKRLSFSSKPNSINQLLRRYVKYTQRGYIPTNKTLENIYKWTPTGSYDDLKNSIWQETSCRVPSSTQEIIDFVDSLSVQALTSIMEFPPPF
jgi:hypothetical protein